MANNSKQYPPDPDRPLLGIVISTAIIFVSVVVFLRLLIDHSYSSLPFCVLFILFGWAVCSACVSVYKEAVSFNDRFEQELHIARDELRILGDENDREAHCRKWFIRITKNARKTREDYEKRKGDIKWIRYLEARSEEGGDVILKWYRRELDLLEMAEHIDANTTKAEHKEAQARENLRIAGVTILGEEEIELERERMRDALLPRKPWEEVL